MQHDEARRGETRETQSRSRPGRRPRTAAVPPTVGRQRPHEDQDDGSDVEAKSDVAAGLQLNRASSSTCTSTSTTALLRRRTPKPNRQRCREFRERRKQYVTELEQEVAALRQQVLELVARRNQTVARLLTRRHHATGSLARLVREYFELFQYGVAVDRQLGSADESRAVSSYRRTLAEQQYEFLQKVVDPETVYGDHKGPEGSLVQWSYYTAAYASFVGEVQHIEVSGSDDDPLLVCSTVYTVVLQRATFKYLFPHAIHNEPLVQRFIGLKVPCPVVAKFQFTPDGKIASEQGDIEIAEAFLKAGCSARDIAELLSGFVVSDTGAIPDRLQTEDHTFAQDFGIDVPKADEGEDDEKHQIPYLLDHEEDEDVERQAGVYERNPSIASLNPDEEEEDEEGQYFEV
ncbi:hypothetical protein PINS_up010425 [Pythium insidiosum]|nr:hypothetical protein PINS_up010425 [Pythium insidiosum]